MSQLDLIIGELKGLQRSRDFEVAHCRADELLIETIVELRRMTNDGYYTDAEVEQLLEAYRAVKKVYA